MWLLYWFVGGDVRDVLVREGIEVLGCIGCGSLDSIVSAGRSRVRRGLIIR